MLNFIADAASFFSGVLYVLIAFVIFMVMIMIHELGHYTAGKLLKFKINEFAIGMGPKIFSKTNAKGEIVSLRALPLGGFCAFEGESEDEPNNPQSFNNQKPWKRLIVLFSGAFFNFISAILFAVIAFSCFGDTVITVYEVQAYAPTANQQLQKDDILYSINGKKIYIAGDFQYYLGSVDDTFEMTVIRNGKYVTLKGLQKATFVNSVIATVNGNYVSDQHTLKGGDTIYSINGICVEGSGNYKEVVDSLTVDTVDLVITSEDGAEYVYKDMPVSVLRNDITVRETSYTGLGIKNSYQKYRYSFGESLARCVPYCFEVAWLVLRTLGGLLTGVVGLDQVSGPIGTLSVTSQVVATGFGNILSLMAMISVNLAVFNLLPVPALDGCQMLFVVIEWIARRPINRKVQAYINGIGLIVLIIFVVLIDILKL